MREAQEKHKCVIQKAERKVVADPENAALKSLLLEYHEMFGSSKTVAQYTCTDGKTHSITRGICDSRDWQVSITRAGKVRIHLTAKGMEDVRSEAEYVESNLEDEEHPVVPGSWQFYE